MEGPDLQQQQQQLKTGGRRSRRVNMWAKAAGEYYHSHKNDPKIKEFSDVLKSPDFKAYYQSKYGHGKNTSKNRNTQRNKTRNLKNHVIIMRKNMFLIWNAKKRNINQK